MGSHRHRNSGDTARVARQKCARRRSPIALLEPLEPRSLLTTYGPLLASTWAQSGPVQEGSTVLWNQYAPIDPITHQRSLAGCVPVAVAEIANFWQFPKQLTITNADAYPFTFPVLTNYPQDAAAAGTLNASELNSTLSNISYAGNPDEMALLTFAVGIKSRAVYSSGNTSAIPSTLLFGQLGFQSAVSSNNWDAAKPHVIDNLKAGMPAFLAIAGPGAAHAVVLDGYDDTTGKFHIRLGWGPYFDNVNGDHDWFSLPAFDAGGFSFSNVTQVIYDISPELPAPQNVDATDGSLRDRVRVTWNGEPLAQGYKLFRSTTNDPATALPIATLPDGVTSFEDTKCASRQTYFYWVKAASSNLCPGSDLSVPASGYSGVPRPATPQNLLPAANATNASLTATLAAGTYNDPSGKAQIAAQWIITRVSDNAVIVNTGRDKKKLTQFTLPTGKLAFSTQYTWRVRFQNEAGTWSDYSAPTTFQTQAAPDPSAGSNAEQDPGRPRRRRRPRLALAALRRVA